MIIGIILFPNSRNSSEVLAELLGEVFEKKLRHKSFDLSVRPMKKIRRSGKN
jgi:hypothetical protein